MQEYDADAKVAYCACTHLSSFTSFAKQFEPQINTMTLDDIKNLNWEEIQANPDSLIVVVLILSIGAFLSKYLPVIF